MDMVEKNLSKCTAANRECIEPHRMQCSPLPILIRTDTGVTLSLKIEVLLPDTSLVLQNPTKMAVS